MKDPERVALRRALRAAVLAPPTFAFCLFALDDETAALFGVFGVIGMLAFADVGGPLAGRAAAYAGMTAVGAALIPPGTLLSGEPFAAAGATAAVAFAIVFASAAGGYVAAGATVVTLAFVLSVAVPGTEDEILSRLLGWAIGGALVAGGSVILWPARVRPKVRAAAADLAESLSGLAVALAEGERDAIAERGRAVDEGSRALVERYLRLPHRPAGPTARDQALLYLVSELRRATEFAGALAGRAPSSAGPEDRALMEASAAVFSQTAAFLRGGPQPELAGLEELRRRHLATLEWEAEAQAGERSQRLVRRAVDVRILSYLAVSVAVNAGLVLGRTVADPGAPLAPLAPLHGARPALARLRELLRANLRPDSVWLQAALRAAVGLGLAVLVALLARIDHAFWVVLGALSALKSSALTTAYTAWQALAGTVAGFALSSALLFASGERHPALWAVLPVCLFLAVYTPTAIHAVVGQATFTLTVVVLFNILEPEGWRTGLVRVEDIAIGCATSLVVGSLLWPRGAGAQLRAKTAALYESGGRFLRAAFGRALGLVPPEEAAVAAAAARGSAARSVDAFATYLAERGPKSLPLETWVQLAGAGHQLRFAGETILAWVAARGPADASPGRARRLEEAVARVERRLDAEARALAAAEPRPPRFSNGEPHEAGAPSGGATFGLLVLREWLDRVQRIADGLAQPVAEAAAVAKRPWWRQ